MIIMRCHYRAEVARISTRGEYLASNCQLPERKQAVGWKPVGINVSIDLHWLAGGRESIPPDIARLDASQRLLFEAVEKFEADVTSRLSAPTIQLLLDVVHVIGGNTDIEISRQFRWNNIDLNASLRQVAETDLYNITASGTLINDPVLQFWLNWRWWHLPGSGCGWFPDGVFPVDGSRGICWLPDAAFQQLNLLWIGIRDQDCPDTSPSPL